MSPYVERLIIAIVVAGCAYVALPTQVHFIDSESDVKNYEDVEDQKAEISRTDFYENVRFTVKQHERREVAYEMYFVAFNKTFVLVLHERLNDTFSFHHPDDINITEAGFLFESKSPKPHTHSNRGTIRYFSGYLRNEPSSRFHGKYNSVSGQLDGVIHVAEEAYYLKPAPLQSYPTNLGVTATPKQKTNFQVLVYRKRDVRLSAPKDVQANPQVGDSVMKPNVHKATQNNGDNVETRHYKRLFRRITRHTSPVYKVCELTAVIHPSFYRKHCDSSITKTIELVRLAVKRADRNFRRVDFNSDNVADNIGFVVKEIKIYTNDSLNDNRLGDYGGDSSQTLYSFAEFDFHKSCLGVLFTHNIFDHRIVGLAFTGHSSRRAAPGGLCHKRTYIQKKLRSLNSLLVSTLNSLESLTLDNLALTLTHELGHAFGAKHDTKMECLPGGRYGMYIMHPTDMETDKVNSDRFSRCSILNMGPVIHNKGSCLKEYEAGRYCGNAIREPDEECDCGRDPKSCRSLDRCCIPPSTNEPGCRIQRELGYVCSPVASPCCTDLCQLETKPRVCRPATECTHATLCDSISVECPDTVPLADGMPCAGGARVCSGGLCIGSRCEQHGWADCTCVHVQEELCQLCCATRNASQSDCKPVYRLSDTDDIVAPIFLKVPATCGTLSGFCTRQHTCIAALPKDDETILGQIILQSSGELADVLSQYWYIIILVVCLLVVFAMLVVVCQAETTMNMKSYSSGQITSVWLILGDHYSALSDQLRFLELQYREKLFEVEENQILDLITGIARLCIFFPTVSRTKIMTTLKRSNCEEFAVRELLMSGYPIKQNFYQTSPIPLDTINKLR